MRRDELCRDEAAELARRASSSRQSCRAATCRPCINHGDLQVANLIGNPPVLIDWEYAQIAAPTYDMACLLTYYPRLQDLQPDLLAASGLTRPEDLELLELQKQLFACLNRLWALANNMPAPSMVWTLDNCPGSRHNAGS